MCVFVCLCVCLFVCVFVGNFIQTLATFLNAELKTITLFLFQGFGGFVLQHFRTKNNRPLKVNFQRILGPLLTANFFLRGQGGCRYSICGDILALLNKEMRL